MIDLQHELEMNIIGESKAFPISKHHMFNNDKLTFKDLKELFTDVFGSRMIKFTKKLPKVDAYLTTTDGEWYVSSYLRPKKSYAVKMSTKINETDCTETDSLQSSFDSIVEALKTIDPILLNRFFANGNNRLHITLVCPPNGHSDAYGKKCFIQYCGIDSFDNGEKVGEDKKSSFELYTILKANPSLAYEFSEISPEQLNSIRRCKDEKAILSNIVNQLSKLVDGIGWNCSIRDYIQDRYSRYLVNKALEHGLDVSKKGALVDELTSRLSGTSALRPTKSDLATFAKREGIDVQSEQYKSFLDDIEQHAQQTNKDILSPIENAIYYAISNAAMIVLGYAAIDPNPKAKKLAQSIASNLFSICDSIENCNCDTTQLDAIKKAIDKVRAYKDIAPQEIRIVNNGTPYSVACECDRFDKIRDIIA